MELKGVENFSLKAQLVYLQQQIYARGWSCCMYTPPSTLYEGRVYYVQEVRAKLPSGRLVCVEAMYSGRKFTKPEQFTARELENFKRLANMVEVLEAEGAR